MDRNEVNASLPTVDIKGKPYVTVDSRVEAFWRLCPMGSIVTEIITDDGSRCVIKATVDDGEGHKVTGHAFEVQSASYINKTSYLENCETSAVGRALGFLGIGSNGSIASADEVQAAMTQQTGTTSGKAKKAPHNAAEKPTAAKERLWNACKAKAAKDGLDAKQYLANLMKREDWGDDDESYTRLAFEIEASL